MATVWSEVEASSKLSEHFVSEVPLSSTAGMVALRKFQQEECAEPVYELQLTANSKNMVLFLPVLALPTGIVAGTEEAKALVETPRWQCCKVLQMMQLHHMVAVGESLESVADFLDIRILGPIEVVKDRLEPSQMYQKVLFSIYSSMPAVSLARDLNLRLSAMQMARMEDVSILVEAIAVRIKQALKLTEFRSYSRSQKARLLEWCALLDIDGSSDEVKGDAFGHLFPNN